MNACNEIVTVQCGTMSNYVGTHWWNLHETNCYSDWDSAVPKGIFNYDILFQRGENWKREVTFTPRLMLFDGKGSFGSVGSLDYFDNLYQNTVAKKFSIEEYKNCSNWTGNVDVITQCGDVNSTERNDFLKALNQNEDDDDNDKVEPQTGQKSWSPNVSGYSQDVEMHDAEESKLTFREKYFELDDKITSWTDYLKPILHPRSLTVLIEHTNKQSILNCENAVENKTGSFAFGEQLCKSYWENVEQNLYYMLEKCDNVQGFQVLSDVYDGVFGGFSSSFIESLKDEMPKKAILTIACCEQPSKFPCIQDCFKFNRGTHIVNTVSTISSFLSNSNCVLPMSLQSDWFPTMIRLSNQQRCCFEVSDIPFHQSAIFATALQGCLAPTFATNEAFVRLSHYCDLLAFNNRKTVLQRLSCGNTDLDADQLKFDTISPIDSSKVDRPSDLSLVSTFCGHSENQENTQLLTKALKRYYSSYSSHFFDIRAPLCWEPPFPTHVFDKLEYVESRGKKEPRLSVPVLSALTNGSCAQSMLMNLVDKKKVLRPNQVSSTLRRLDMDSDLFEEKVEIINSEVDRYNEQHHY